MSAPHDSTDGGPLPHGVDETCDAFEAAWVRGEHPRIEDYLVGSRISQRSVLLEELLISEWALRERGGERIDLHRYLSRFPDDARLVEAVWAGRRQWLGDGPVRGEPAPLIGQTVSRFKIRELLGSGGMGHVYLADERMRRCFEAADPVRDLIKT